jgi:hypothetical protein
LKSVGVEDSFELAVPDPTRKSRPFRCAAITIEHKEGICRTQQTHVRQERGRLSAPQKTFFSTQVAKNFFQHMKRN